MKNRIGELRMKKTGLTQKQFSKKYDIPRTTLEGNESGRFEPRGHMMLVYSKILGEPVEKIFSLELTDLPQILRE